jgi:hypothetical protein
MGIPLFQEMICRHAINLQERPNGSSRERLADLVQATQSVQGTSLVIGKRGKTKYGREDRRMPSWAQ